MSNLSQLQRIELLEQRLDGALEQLAEMGLASVDDGWLRGIRFAAADEAVPVYLTCYEDLDPGDHEAFVGLIHPDFAAVCLAAANKQALGLVEGK